VFSFNDVSGRFNFTWEGFTLRWYGDLFEIPQLADALRNSFIVAVIAALGSTALGTLLALGVSRLPRRARTVADAAVLLPLMMPSVVLGTALLSMFVTLGTTQGLSTIVLAHVTFTISFVAVVVGARIARLDPVLEDAARDLGASSPVAFRTVLLPQLTPGIGAGVCLALGISLDDFLVTSFVAGGEATFPLWTLSLFRSGLPPQIYVVGTLFLVLGIALAVASVVLDRRPGLRTERR
jgi:spermidine/putrescine transport system permease protein